MSEKLDKLIISVEELKLSKKTDIRLMRGFMLACGGVMLYFITFMNATGRELEGIKSILATKDNIVKLRTELRNEIGAYLPMTAYIEIENQRSYTVAELFCIFGEKYIHVKEEELEKFRTSAIFKLNNQTKLGTTRGQN